MMKDTPIKFVQARYFRKANRPAVKWVVIHTAEIAELSRSAEALGNYAANMADGRTASWHYAVDADSVVQSVREEDVAWAAPGANMDGIQVELSGYARQTSEQWADHFSQLTLMRAAKLVAGICTRWDIPVTKLDAAAMKRGERGICGHDDVTRGVGKGKTYHYDPGPEFPWEAFIGNVASYM